MKNVVAFLTESYQGVVIVVLIMNFLGFGSMGMDKWLARKHKWRIPERTLLGVAAAFGSFGSLFGMHYFHHKTKKVKFFLGVPCILVLQVGIVCFVFFRQ